MILLFALYSLDIDIWHIHKCVQLDILYSRFQCTPRLTVLVARFGRHLKYSGFVVYTTSAAPLSLPIAELFRSKELPCRSNFDLGGHLWPTSPQCLRTQLGAPVSSATPENESGGNRQVGLTVIQRCQ